jgi:hypothetical protein
MYRHKGPGRLVLLVVVMFKTVVQGCLLSVDIPASET